MGEMQYELTFETVSLDRSGQVTARRQGRASALALPLGGGAVLDLVLIPGGQFLMGSPTGEGYPDERPQHPVSIASFLLGRYPVTQDQWAAVMGDLPACRFRGARRPVENVSWQESLEFCRRLTEMAGRPLGLPSEAQWEYACRAGTVTPFSCGETITSDLADYVGEHTYAGEPPGLYRHGTTDVGTFPANSFGLCDMHGLLWEFCADAWRPSYGEEPGQGSAPALPPASARARAAAYEAAGPSRFRVARGGSWHDGPALCRSAARLRCDREYGDDFYGLRVAGPI